MNLRCFSIPALIAQIASSLVLNAEAGTIVLANRTSEAVSIQLGGEARQLASGEVLPIRSATSQTIRFSKSLRPFYTIDPNAIYFLGPSPPSRVDLIRIGLGGDAASSSIFESDLVSGVPSSESRDPGLVTIPVKIFVDDEEAAQRESWERRLRDRFKEASAIFERHCFVRFEVTAVGTWNSDDLITEFEMSLRDFERKVRPQAARLAIGFTSQYRIKPGRMHLGGTRGPMHSHLLIREWSHQINEPERLEVLLHELGHFLGAVHSPEPDSVMRPVLGDRQARAANFRIGFDPVNTLAMCLVSDAIRVGRVTRFTEMNLPTQLELHKLYGEISKAYPSDKTPSQYVGILETSSIDPLVRGAKLVVMGIGSASEENSKSEKLREDALTEFYVRRAAEVAAPLPREVGPRAFLLGLVVGLDRTASLQEHRLVGTLCERIESEGERKARLEFMGVPTAHAKHELARHFAIAAALSAVVGPESAERACLALQLGNSTNAGDFNPAIYQADLAGIVFAYRVLSGSLPLAEVADGFVITEHLPHRENQAGSISPADFAEQYGSVSDPRFRKLREELSTPLRKLAE